MMHDLKRTDIERVAEKGSAIYAKIKNQYEPEYAGKFLAIDIRSKTAFLGETSSDAVEAARKKYPGKIFYVVKIGYSAAEILSNLTLLRA